MRLGLEEKRAWRSARNGRGPWWNAGASHLNQALPKRLFARLGLLSLVNYDHQLQTFNMGRRGTEPYARWCRRTAGAIPPPTR